MRPTFGRDETFARAEAGERDTALLPSCDGAPPGGGERAHLPGSPGAACGSPDLPHLLDFCAITRALGCGDGERIRLTEGVGVTVGRTVKTGPGLIPGNGNGNGNGKGEGHRRTTLAPAHTANRSTPNGSHAPAAVRNGNGSHAPAAVPEDERISFEEIWSHRAELHDLCQRIVGDAALADDLVQETFVQVLRNLDRLERRGGLMPWLVTVARRRSLNELRRRKYSTPVDTLPEPSSKPEADPCEVVSVTDEVERVRSILGTLTPREHDLLMRQVYEGLSLAELAEHEHTSVASVRSVLSRARSKIKAALGETGARVLAPVAAIGTWLRSRLPLAGARAQQLEPAVATGYEGLGRVITAAIVSLTLVLAGVPNPDPATEHGRARPPSGSRATEGPGDATLDLIERGAPAPGGGVRGEAPPPASDPGASTAGASAGNADQAGSPKPSGNTDPLSPGQALPEVPPPPSPEQLPPVEEQADEPEDASGWDFFSPAQWGTPAKGGSSEEPGNDQPNGETGSGPDAAASPASTGAAALEIFALGSTGENCRGSCSVLFHSTDGGATWERLPAKNLRATAVLLPPAYPADPRIYAMGPTGLQVSKDAGLTFEPVAAMPHSGPVAMSPGFSSGDARILVGTNPAWEYDAKADEARLFDGIPPLTTRTEFVFTPDYPSSKTLFAGSLHLRDSALHPAVYTCRQQREGNRPKDLCDRPVLLEGVASVPRVAVSSTFATDHLVFAWSDGLFFRSDDAGATFQPVRVPFATVTAVSDDGAGVVYAAGYTTTDGRSTGGVARSLDGGLTWTLLGAGTVLEQGASTVRAIPGGPLLAAPLSRVAKGFLCSVDGGITWAARCPAVTS